METITNAASTAATTVSNLIYGAPAKDTDTVDKDTANNETAGKEPLSGQQGKGTANEPFDQGNAANPVNTPSTTKPLDTSSQSDDFLKLNPELGKPTTTESSTGTSTGATSETAMPIVPLNPDVATSGVTANPSSSTETGITDKAGVTDKLWKPTPIDDVTRAGAPGAGPSAPDFTPATPATALGTSTSKDPSTTETHHGSSVPAKDSATDSTGPISDLTPKAEHSVDDREVESPHSKMTDRTVRNTDASKTGGGGDPKSLAADATSGHQSEPSKSHEAASPTTDEKGGKISHFKDRLKGKFHIGSKDK